MPANRTVLFFVLVFLAALSGQAFAGTGEITAIKYANDGVTVIDEKTIDYKWMEKNLPVYGDGVTHYYHQGPVFEAKWEEVHPDLPYNMWNPEEDINYETKDMGAVKGSSVRDICDLVSSMDEGDEVKIVSEDGFFKYFPYENVYSPPSRQGEIVIAWYTGSSESSGYVPLDYREGMRLVFLADTTTNPTGDHVFGITDMEKSLDEDCWHYFNGVYPTTTGLSIQKISRVEIYSDDDPPNGILNIKSTPSGATVFIDDEEYALTDCNIDTLDEGSYLVRVEKDGYKPSEEKSVSISLCTQTSLEFTLEEQTSEYFGKELRLFEKGSVNGSVFVLKTDGNPEVLGSDDLAKYTLKTGISKSDEINSARLFVYIGNSRDTSLKSGLKPECEVLFNGKKKEPEREYFDLSKDVPSYYSETFAYDVKDSLKSGDEQIITVKNTGNSDSEFTSYGAALFLTVKNESCDRILWWGYEGCDIIMANPNPEGEEGEFITSANQNGDVEASPGEARLSIIYSCPEDPPGLSEKGENSVFFNDEEWFGVLNTDDSCLKSFESDVLPFMKKSNNEIRIKSIEGSKNGALIETRNVFLINKAGGLKTGASDESNEDAGDIRKADNPASVISGADNKSAVTTGINETLGNAVGEKPESVGILEGFISGIWKLIFGEEEVSSVSIKETDLQVAGGENKNSESDKDIQNKKNYDISVKSNPRGALIYLDGVYTGKTTPEVFLIPAGESHKFSIKKDYYQDYDEIVTAGSDCEIVADMTSLSKIISDKEKFDLFSEIPANSNSGGLYVNGPSKGLSIYIDNKDTSRITPDVVSGIKAGRHTVTLGKKTTTSTGRESLEKTGSLGVYVYGDSVCGVFVPESENTKGSDISFDSAVYKDNSVSFKGVYSGLTIPCESEITGSDSYLTVLDEDRYLSYYIQPDARVSHNFKIEPYNDRLYEIYVESEPKGAEIFIDGFRTGFSTPYKIDGLSCGFHEVTLSKPGYIPSSGTVRILMGSDEEFAGVVHVEMKEYPSGRLYVTSKTDGAKIYINGKYSGEITPHLFTDMNIGTYAVKLVSGSSKKEIDSVTIEPYETFECYANLGV
ncbi:PEGA domain-containing protein [Methanoplanus sp. FWC-SCC4]|uniref:PEGA domain-containing protein n=1 Tax=Methanochimaera problematica TaxID=2609417 RepID=A0AA97FET3_9EURY|nr:PEGA domain-containing protein [Methanoplanus sp. FWC-SCC4]WOF16968.1 PEGA domain-containing protein [Methanoplanus sp. FWC-SCC4]